MFARVIDLAAVLATLWWIAAVYVGAGWALSPGGMTGLGLWAPLLVIGARMLVVRSGWPTWLLRTDRAPDPDEHEPRRTRLLTMLLAALSLLLTELLFTRIFSVVLRYHFAFMAISVALLGLGIAGVLIYLLRDRLSGVHLAVPVAWLAALQAIATVGGLAALLGVTMMPGYSPDNLVRLVRIYLVALAPMLLGGMIITLLLSFRARDVGRLYRNDLLGAAGAALLFVPFTQWLGAPTAMVVAAMLAAVAGWILARGAGYRRGSRLCLVVAGSMALLTVVDLSAGVFTLGITKGRDQSTAIFSRWNSFSRVAVYEQTHPPYGVSDDAVERRPPTLFLDIDAAASTPILRLRQREVSSLDFFDATVTAYAYALRGQGEALVIGAGGGRDVLSALYHGFSRVDAVEINPIIANEIMRGRFADYAGNVYSMPGVHLHVDDGRGFAHRSPRTYDVVQLSLVDTWAATSSGAYILAENNLYTVEAIEDYLEHLNPQGILSIARWPQGGLRTLSLFVEASERLGLGPPVDRAIVLRQKNLYAMLLKREPFERDEIIRILRRAREDGFAVLHVPGTRQRPSSVTKLLLDPPGFIAQAEDDLSPVTDDRPFFFNFTRLEDIPDALVKSRLLFGDGLSNLVTVLVLSTGLALVCIVLPMALVRRRAPGPSGSRVRAARMLGYFCCLGFGFIVLEIALMQKLTLLLGHPTLSLVVALGGLLLGSGVGAGFAGTKASDVPTTRAALATAAVAALSVLLSVVIADVVAAGLDRDLVARLAMAVVLTLPLGFAMGLPLPLGIRVLDRDAPHLIPWAWGLNGAVSVVGSSGALFIGMFFGFSTAMLVAAAAYGLALLCVLGNTAPATPHDQGADSA